MKHYTKKEWEQSIKQDKNAQIIDVRSAEEFEEKHWPGALQINVENPQKFMDHIDKLDKDKNYYLYCNSGKRSNQACLVMEYNGFKNLFNLEDGLQ